MTLTTTFLLPAAFLTGLSLTLPLTATINSAHYFDGRLQGSPLAFIFTSLFTTVFIVVRFVTVLTQLVLHTSPQCPKRGAWCMAGLQGVYLVLLLIPESFIRGWLEMAVLTLTLLIAATSAVVEAGVFACLSSHPPSATQAVFLGQGVAGIWSAGLSLLLQVTLPAEARSSWTFALFNFGLSLLIVIMCAVAWWLVDRTIGLYRPYKTPTTQPSVPEKTLSLGEYYRVYMSIQDLALAVFNSCTLAMLMFPFMVNKTESANERASEQWRMLFRPTAFFVNAVADLAARWFPSLRYFSSRSWPLFRLSFVRIIIFLVLLFGNLRIDGKSLPASFSLKSDVLFFTALIASGLANGFIITLSTMKAPKRFSEDSDRSKAARVMNMCNFAGRVVGCLLSLLLAFILRSLVAT